MVDPDIAYKVAFNVLNPFVLRVSLEIVVWIFVTFEIILELRLLVQNSLSRVVGGVLIYIFPVLSPVRSHKDCQPALRRCEYGSTSLRYVYR